MGKSYVPMIVLLGVVLVFGVSTSASQAETLGRQVVMFHSQWAIDQDASEHSIPLTRVKQGRGKGGNSHGAKDGGKHKSGHKKAERHNAGESQVRGLDRADDVAGEYGQRGRAKARKQHGRDHEEE